MQIFLDDVDYRKFLFILSDVLDAYDIDCWDLCLMPNHYHLALRNREPNLPEAMQHLNGEYGFWWNARHVRVGHVFQGRYKDQIVQREGHLHNLVRYIALNSVRGGLVTSPELWPWSAYRCIAGLAPNPGYLCPQAVLDIFGEGGLATLRQRYTRHVLSGIGVDDESYRRFRSRQRILGDRQFKLLVRKSLAAVNDVATDVVAAAPIG